MTICPAQGPSITRYRGLHIVKSKAFSMEQGAAPRDLLRRRVRVAEFYLLPVGVAGPQAVTTASAADGPSTGLMRGKYRSGA